MYHALELSHNRYYDLTINPETHMRNEIFHFWCHELNRIHKYDKGPLSRHVINKDNCFCWSWQWLPRLSLFYFSHLSRRIFVRSLLWVSQSESSSLHQWWLQSDFTICPGRGRHLLSPISPPLIYLLLWYATFQISEFPNLLKLDQIK